MDEALHNFSDTHVDFLLLEPQEGGNLGSICRALKTMGFGPPKLVAAPPGIERSPEARRLAHGARDYLQKIERVADPEALFTGYDFLVGTTARRRRTVGEYLPVTQLAPLLKEKGSSISRVAILFGSEASGLPSTVLHRCHLVSTVPLSTTYPSLNLAQAVLLYAHQLGQFRIGATVTAGAAAETPGAGSDRDDGSPVGVADGTESYDALLRRLEALLENRGNPALLGKVRERLVHIDGNDVALIHSLLNALESRDRC